MKNEAVQNNGLGSGSRVGASSFHEKLRRPRSRHVDRRTNFRLIFAGPVGAGKTTAVRALSDVAPVDTDVPISPGSPEYGDGDKKTTTVGLDYGHWSPTPDISVALVGVPGQDRFASARRSPSSADTRILLWLRADRGDIVADADAWITRFDGDRHRIVVAVSHCSSDAFHTALGSLAEVLQRHAIPETRVFAADARDRESVLRVACVALDLPEEES
ncbi:hypothetical protein AB0O87_04130 [Microbacterium sp. NPDC076768]|uniref:GTP-binding protein n=1 Tax=Microbacterium sp. NPDC076768 TaxID=3154858 RepID=UPI00342E2995